MGRRSALEAFFLREWAGGSVAQLLLRPLSCLYRLIFAARAHLANAGTDRLTTARAGLRAPLVVVGNVTVGGSGKTPCVMALATALAARGWRPGVVSRGYGGRGRVEPVTPQSTASEVGDEPLLIARRTGLPVWVGPDRFAAARALLAAQPGVDVLISDDGLQHLALPRDVEIVVVDARRGLGNRRLLPAGPLREPVERLTRVDQVWVCGSGPLPAGVPAGRLHLQSDASGVTGDAASTPAPVRVGLALASTTQRLGAADQTRPLGSFAGQDVVALAGIAAPERFFAMLTAAGIDAMREPWPDHHAFTAADLSPLRGRTVLMTQKDAVKCESFIAPDCAPDWWVVPLEATIPAAAVDAVERDLRRACSARVHTGSPSRP